MSAAHGDTATEVRAAQRETVVPTKRYRVTVTEGPDAGQTLDLDFGREGPALVGSSPVCALRLADRSVSRRHASLDVTETGVRLVDLGSTNGSVVRGLRVRDVVVVAGDVISVAGTTLRLDAVDDMDASKASAPAVSPWHRFGRMVGASLAMRRLYATCQQLAASNLSIVVEGETGTGKELLAEAIHDASARATGPFVVFDCSSTPAALLDSALFGHERGAFTGAVEARTGVFEAAHGGTLLLDEIGELDALVQPKLLRALEQSAIQRVGSNARRSVDVRVIASTRRDLDREVSEGRFRDDLFYRLVVGRLALPPLRERRGDVTLLTQHFWAELGGDERPIPEELLARFEAYEWPGNVRELHNAVARFIALGEVGTMESVPAPNADSVSSILALDLPFPRARQMAADDFERRYVERVLARYGGNVARAAKASGIARRYFQILRARSRDE